MFRLPHNKVTLMCYYCTLSTAYWLPSSGDGVDWLCLIISSTVAVGDWRILILAVVVNG